MNGYEYLVARNRLMQQLDVQLAELYAQVADEYPGERKKKARPIVEPQ
jgi:uncharacterized protein